MTPSKCKVFVPSHTYRDTVMYEVIVASQTCGIINQTIKIKPTK